MSETLVFVIAAESRRLSQQASSVSHGRRLEGIWSVIYHMVLPPSLAPAVIQAVESISVKFPAGDCEGGVQSGGGGGKHDGGSSDSAFETLMRSQLIVEGADDEALSRSFEVSSFCNLTVMTTTPDASAVAPSTSGSEKDEDSSEEIGVPMGTGMIMGAGALTLVMGGGLALLIFKCTCAKVTEAAEEVVKSMSGSSFDLGSSWRLQRMEVGQNSHPLQRASNAGRVVKSSVMLDETALANAVNTFVTNPRPQPGVSTSTPTLASELNGAPNHSDTGLNTYADANPDTSFSVEPAPPMYTEPTAMYQ